MSAGAKRHPDSEQSILGTWIMTPLSFVERIVNGAVSAVTGTIASYVDLRHARAENTELREKNDQMLGELNELREHAAEERGRKVREAIFPNHVRISLGFQFPRRTRRTFSLLLFGVLSLSPVVLVVIHRLPSIVGSTVRRRPYVPTKNCCAAARLLPLIGAR